MERYAARLESAGYRSAADAARLQRQDLVALGITLAGHQRKILGSAADVVRSSSPHQSSASAIGGGAGASFV